MQTMQTATKNGECTEMIEKSTEYAVFLPPKGWVIPMFGAIAGIVVTENENFEGFSSPDEAKLFLDRTRERYAALGAEEVGNRLVIVTRTTTVDKSDWAIPNK